MCHAGRPLHLCFILQLLQGNPVAEFGQQLQDAGYSYHGGETMVSGITGEEFKVCLEKFDVRAGQPLTSALLTQLLRLAPSLHIRNLHLGTSLVCTLCSLIITGC